MSQRRDAPDAAPAFLEARGVVVDFTTRGGAVARALDGVDLSIDRGEILAIVGESGSGKTTLARTLMGLQRPAAGEVRVDGRADGLLDPSAAEGCAVGCRWCCRTPRGRSTPARPSTSRSPRGSGCTGWPRGGEHGSEADQVAQALSNAGLRPPQRLFLRYPHELSGGQRQRVLIAGALAVRPELIIADEPVSSLDASIRGELLALLLRLRDELQLGVAVVTHDLGLAWNIADRIAVMYLGRVVESGTHRGGPGAPAPPLHPGAAVGGPRDRAHRAGRPDWRDPGPDAHPRRLPLPSAVSPAARRCRRGRRRLGCLHLGAARGAARRRRSSGCLPPRRRATGG